MLIVGAVLVFIAADPFMWFMPMQHLKDLVYKAVFHYAEFHSTHLNLVTLLAISSLTIISICLALSYLLSSKKLGSPLPRAFILTLLPATLVLYVIFMTARSQGVRYYMPIIFIWEVLLPLFLFALAEKMGKRKKTFKIYFLLLLCSYPVILFIVTLCFN